MSSTKAWIGMLYLSFMYLNYYCHLRRVVIVPQTPHEKSFAIPLRFCEEVEVKVTFEGSRKAEKKQKQQVEIENPIQVPLQVLISISRTLYSHLLDY